MYKKIVDEWGTVDIVVNSAGVCLTGELTEESLENIDKTIDINIKGTIYSCREALNIMRANKYGKIVNMSSIAAKACSAGFSVYSCTKSAVLALTASLGREAAKIMLMLTVYVQELLEQVCGKISLIKWLEVKMLLVKKYGMLVTM